VPNQLLLEIDKISRGSVGSATIRVTEVMHQDRRWGPGASRREPRERALRRES